MNGNTATLRRTELALNFVIDSEHIVLEPISLRFLGEIHATYTEEIAECMFTQPCTNPCQTKERICMAVEKMLQGIQSTFVVRNNVSGTFIGCAELRHPKDRPNLELWIAKKYQHQGYGTETLHMLRKYAQDILRPPHKFITALVSKQNEPAHRLMLKVGGILQQAEIHKRNEYGIVGVLNTYRFYW